VSFYIVVVVVGTVKKGTFLDVQKAAGKIVHRWLWYWFLAGSVGGGAGQRGDGGIVDIAIIDNWRRADGKVVHCDG